MRISNGLGGGTPSLWGNLSRKYQPSPEQPFSAVGREARSVPSSLMKTHQDRTYTSMSEPSRGRTIQAVLPHTHATTAEGQSLIRLEQEYTQAKQSFESADRFLERLKRFNGSKFSVDELQNATIAVQDSKKKYIEAKLAYAEAACEFEKRTGRPERADEFQQMIQQARLSDAVANLERVRATSLQRV